MSIFVIRDKILKPKGEMTTSSVWQDRWRPWGWGRAAQDFPFSSGSLDTRALRGESRQGCASLWTAWAAVIKHNTLWQDPQTHVLTVWRPRHPPSRWGRQFLVRALCLAGTRQPCHCVVRQWGERPQVCPSSCKDTNPNGGLLPWPRVTLFTSQGPHFQIAPCWTLGLQRRNANIGATHRLLFACGLPTPGLHVLMNRETKTVAPHALLSSTSVVCAGPSGHGDVSNSSISRRRRWARPRVCARCVPRWPEGGVCPLPLV